MTKPKTCRICKKPFIATNPLAKVCSYECALIFVKNNREKETKKKASLDRQDRARMKERLKSRGQWVKDCQVVFNAWIRKRDEGLPCISCGSLIGQRHASHFYATSIRPNLRFDESNVHASCARCNKWMHGNLIPYRTELGKRIGKDELDRLDADIEPKHYSIQDLKDIKELYKNKTKAL